MAESRPEPRSFATQPRLFGAEEILRWDSLADAVLSASAQTQHRIAFRIRRKLSANKRMAARVATQPETPLMSRRDLAGRFGVTYDHMVKLLNGTRWMTLHDVSRADLLLGEISDYSLATVSGPSNTQVDSARADTTREWDEETHALFLRRVGDAAFAFAGRHPPQKPK